MLTFYFISLCVFRGHNDVCDCCFRNADHESEYTVCGRTICAGRGVKWGRGLSIALECHFVLGMGNDKQVIEHLRMQTSGILNAWRKK